MTILILQTEIAILILLLEITHKINHNTEIAITHKAEQIPQIKPPKDQATLQVTTVHTEAAAAICLAELAECPVAVAVAVVVAVAEEWVAEEDKKH